jgi:hypothetical protein
MDDLIEQLRDANPQPQPAAMPIELIWEALERSEKGHRRGRSLSIRREALGRAIGWVPVICGAGVAVVIVVIVGLSIRGHHRLVTGSRTPPVKGSHSPPGRCSPSSQPAEGPLPVLPGQRIHTAGRPGSGILDEIQLLREPISAQDETAAACAARTDALNYPLPPDSRYRLRADPAYVRYVGPGVLGGRVFMYPLPGIPPRIAHRGMPSGSRFAHAETEPAVCLITIGGNPGANPSGCARLRQIKAGAAELQAAQIRGTSMSTLAAIVRDGITAVRVYDGAKLIKTVSVHHNVVQFIVGHNAPAAAHLRLLPTH